MKKVSARMFFTVMWRGVCQVLGWFFGLFGYKRDGKFAKCVWRLFATSSAIIVSLVAFALLFHIGEGVYDRCFRSHHCEDEECCHVEYVSRYLSFHNTDDGYGYIYDRRTGEKLLRHVAWIANPLGRDSLVCFSNGKKRGYFSMNTGEVVIEPKYDHAWIFSDGLASVDEGGRIKFIDATGKVVIDKNMPFIPDMEGYVFHGGYCVVDTDDGEKCGLMDVTGKIVLPLEYSYIYPTSDYKYWHVQKGEKNGVLDDELKPIIPLMECSSLYILDDAITVTMLDHSIRCYDMQGTLINDFYMVSVSMLEYEKEEIVYPKNKVGEDNEGESDEPYHPKATARLRSYVAGNGYEGLMTADGHRVTMPLYWEIEALDRDLYLCSTKNGEKVIVNGKGEIVK